MDTDKLKEAFTRIKQEMSELKQDISLLKAQVSQIHSFLNQFLNSSTSAQEVRQIAKKEISNHQNYSDLSLISDISTGNEGVPADKQTDSQQTFGKPTDTLKRTLEANSQDIKPKDKSHELFEIIKDLKKDLRDKFRKLTKQEFLIFSTLYMLEEEKGNVHYKDIAVRTGLTESSIRDYISKLERKGLPIIKEKINNKVIILRIPRELRNIETLDNLSNLTK